jgi:hypothetical protein
LTFEALLTRKLTKTDFQLLFPPDSPHYLELMAQVSAGNELYVRGQEAIQVYLEAKRECNVQANTVNLSQDLSDVIIENINFERIDQLKSLALLWNQSTQDLPERIRGLIFQLSSQKLSQPELFIGNTYFLSVLFFFFLFNCYFLSRFIHYFNFYLCFGTSFSLLQLAFIFLLIFVSFITGFVYNRLCSFVLITFLQYLTLIFISIYHLSV